MTGRLLSPTALALTLVLVLVARSMQRTLEVAHLNDEDSEWEQEDLITLRRRILDSLGIDEAHVTSASASAGNSNRVHMMDRHSTYTLTFPQSDQGHRPAFTSSGTTIQLSFQVSHSATNSAESITEALLRLPLQPSPGLPPPTGWTVSMDGVHRVAGTFLQGEACIQFNVTGLLGGLATSSSRYSFTVLCPTECSQLPQSALSTLSVTLRSGGLNLRTRRSANGPNGQTRHHRRHGDKLAGKLRSFKPSHEAQVDCVPGGSSNQCCRKSMEVSFKDLNLEKFILSPSDFNAYYCVGKCRKKQNMASTHAVIQHLMHGQKKVPRPCCAPSKLGHLNITMVPKDGNLANAPTIEWKNVIVEECACS